jgi:hypothetical protein
MEDQLVQLLANTQSADQVPRQQAEIDLKRAQTNPAFPTALANVAAHASISIPIRQSALSTLRLFIESNWAIDDPSDDPQIPISDDVRTQLRQTLLDLALGHEEDRKVKIAARLVPPALASRHPTDAQSNPATLSARLPSTTIQSIGRTCSLPSCLSSPQAPTPSSMEHSAF